MLPVTFMTTMVYRAFPDLQWLRQQAEEGFASGKAWGGQTLPVRGWPSVILHVQAKNICRDNIRGPLSVFTNVTGKSRVTCGSKQVTIQEGYFFITNHDQRYTLEIDKNEPTETLNIHFGEYFADQVFNTLKLQPAKLLDNGFFTAPHNRIECYNKLYYRDSHFNLLAGQLKNNNGNNLFEEEKLYELMVHLLRQNNEVTKIERNIPALKNATRHEIVKRLLAATDYIYSFYHRDITLEELAGVACLSKFHFLRLFKIAFHKTPHQFINDVKVEHARVLLRRTAMEVNTIARLLGFENTSSFSRMFYHQTGLYPSQYR
jgi:AraC family transcriptional regulator